MAERTRTKDEGGFTTLCLEYEKTLSGDILGVNETYIGNKKHKYIRDEVTPGFHQLQKCGKFLPLNGLDIYTEFEHRTAASFNVTNDLTTKMEGDYYYPEYSRGIDPPSLDLDKLGECVLGAAANAATAQWDVMTFMAEAEESVETLRGIAHAFNHKTKTLAEQAARFRKNPFKAFNQLWLGWRFGVRPMISDAQNAVKAIKGVKGEWIKGRDRDSEDLTNQKDTLHDFYGRFKLLVREKITGTRTYRGYAVAETDMLVGTRVGMDPLVTAWEVIPYSFVVDYFISIGNWVSTIRPMLVGDYLGICSSVKTEYSYRREVILAEFHEHWTGTVTNSLTEVDIEQYTRAPASVAFPAPRMELSVPKMYDVAALFLKGRADVYRILQTAFNGRPKR